MLFLWRAGRFAGRVLHGRARGNCCGARAERRGKEYAVRVPSWLFEAVFGRDSGGRKVAAGIFRRDLASKIAYIPQSYAPAFDHTVLDSVLMGMTAQMPVLAQPGPEQEQKAMQALQELGIEKLARRGCTRISGGERQLMLLARALVQDAGTLIMDEPTANLDYGNSSRVMQRVRKLGEKGYSVVFSTHDPNQAFSYATKVLALKSGRVLACGRPEEVLTQEILSALYGVQVSVCQVELPHGKRTICLAQTQEA